MKRLAIIIVLAIALPFCLFADSFRFSIVWESSVTSESNIYVVDTNDDTDVASKGLSLTVDEQPVARIKYTTNEGGTPTLYYKATPLITNGDNKGYRFILRFYYPTTSNQSAATINVGDNKNLTYPNGQMENSAYSTLNMGESGSLNSDYVLVTVQLLDLDIMPIDKQYTSTITIVRQAT